MKLESPLKADFPAFGYDTEDKVVSDQYRGTIPTARTLSDKEISQAYKDFQITRYASKEDFMSHMSSKLSPSQKEVYYQDYTHREALIASGQYNKLRAEDYKRNYLRAYSHMTGYDNDIYDKISSMPISSWIKLSSLQRSKKNKMPSRLLPNLNIYYDKDANAEKRNLEIQRALDRILTPEEQKVTDNLVIERHTAEDRARQAIIHQKQVNKSIYELGIKVAMSRETKYAPRKYVNKTSLLLLTIGKAVNFTSDERRHLQELAQKELYSDIRYEIMYKRDLQSRLYRSYKDSSRGQYIPFFSKAEQSSYENWKSVNHR